MMPCGRRPGEGKQSPTAILASRNFSVSNLTAPYDVTIVRILGHRPFMTAP